MIYEEFCNGNLTIFVVESTSQNNYQIQYTAPVPIKNHILNSLIEKIVLFSYNIFGENLAQPNSQAQFTIPFQFCECITRIFARTWLSNPATENKIKLCFAGILISDNLPEKELNNFDEALKDALDKYLQVGKKKLEINHNSFSNIYQHIIQLQNLEVNIDENYTITSAINDFKKGMNFYRNRKWKTSYPFLKRAYLKFIKENQTELLLEVSYLLGNSLIQLKKYAAALEYFDELEQLALGLKNKKYVERTHFMQGFCNYKEHHFQEAIRDFEKIDPSKIKFINRFHYYSFKGRAFAQIKKYDDAIELLKIAKAKLGNQKPTKSTLIQKATIEFDIGIYYHQTLNIKLKNPENKIILNSEIFNYHLEKSIKYFLSAIEIWKKIGSIHKILETYQIIGNIYGYLQNYTKELKYYHLALEQAKILNDFTSRIRLTSRIIQIFDLRSQYQSKISLLQSTLDDFDQYVYIDNETIAFFHLEMGRAFLQINKINLAENEFLIALNIYQKIKPPLIEELTCLNNLINLYNIIDNKGKIEYYQDLKLKVSSQINAKEVKYQNPLHYIKDCWIITTSGLELFSYNPNIQLEPTLFGGFITALQCFSKEISAEELDSFKIGESQYIFYFEEPMEFYILARVDLNESEDFIKKILKLLYNRFFIEYKKYLTPFYGDVQPFQNFIETLEKIDLNLIE